MKLMYISPDLFPYSAKHHHPLLSLSAFLFSPSLPPLFQKRPFPNKLTLKKINHHTRCLSFSPPPLLVIKKPFVCVLSKHTPAPFRQKLFLPFTINCQTPNTSQLLYLSLVPIKLANADSVNPSLLYSTNFDSNFTHIDHQCKKKTF